MRFFTTLSATLFLLMVFTSNTLVQAAIPPRCGSLLLTEEQATKMAINLLTEYKENAKFIQRQLVKRKIRRMGNKKKRNTILEACARRGGCTEKDLEDAVKEEIEYITGTTKNMKAFIVISLVTGALSIAAPHAKEALPKSIQGLGRLIEIIANVGVAGLFYPVAEQVKRTIDQRQREKLNADVVLDATQADNVRRLEKVDTLIGGAYTLSARRIGGEMETYLIALQQAFYQAHRAIYDDTTFGRLEAVDAIARIARQTRILKNSLPSNNELVVDAIQTTFLNHRSPALVFEIRQAAFQRLLETDVETHDPTVKKYYEDLLEAWFRPSPYSHFK